MTVGTIQDSIVVPANDAIDNVLDKKRFRKVPQEAQQGVFVDLYCTGEAPGLTAELFIAGRNPLEKSKVNSENRYPREQEDALITGAVAAVGEEMTLSVTNTTAAPITFFYKMTLEDE